jgi:AbrB family looped-hinge helix DNA binding protein
VSASSFFIFPNSQFFLLLIIDFIFSSLYILLMMYITLTEKGQITVPVDIRRTLNLLPGKKLNIAVRGDEIVIQKPVVLEDVRRLLQAEMEKQGTVRLQAESGAGWAADVEERFGES